VACCRDGVMSCADREKGGASLLQVWFPVQLLPRRRSKSACVCAYIHVLRGVKIAFIIAREEIM